MSPRTVRRILVAVCVVGIPGMIATSIADANGGALTFGLITAAAATALILVTATTSGAGEEPGAADERIAEQVEARIRTLVAGGADEDELRRLVGEAVRLGRSQR